MLKNKTGNIFGVANRRSIAWASAQALHEACARLAITYQGERLKENVEKLTRDWPETLLVPCDVANQAKVDATFVRVGEAFSQLDFLVYSIAFAPKEALEGDFFDTECEAFTMTLEISAYFLARLARAAAPMMTDDGSIVDDDLFGCRAGGAQLQRDGRGQGRARG